MITGLAAMLAFSAAAPLAAQERRDRDRDRTELSEERRGWLGFMYDFRDDSDRSITIVEVHSESPAERAGLREGDVVVEIDGRAPTPDAMRELHVEDGDRVRVRLRRDDREREITIVAEERPRRLAARDFQFVIPRVEDGDRVIILNGDTLRIAMDSLMVHMDSLHSKLRVFYADSLAPKLREFQREFPEFEFRFDGDRVMSLPDDFGAFYFRDGDGWEVEGNPGAWALFGHRGVAGAEFTELNRGLAEYFGTDEGVLVLRVAPETPAARAGLEAGDVVVQVNGEDVDSVGELRQRMARAASQNEAVRLRVIRKGTARELELSQEGDSRQWWGNG